MEDNTGEEHPDNPTDMNPETPVDEISPNKETVEPIQETVDPIQETLAPIQEAESMEVHHHSHSSHGKKGWKSYFWEFLMLFLAVFCGFLAEYQLEHTIEHQREKTLMKSLVEDLKTDSKQLQKYIDWRTETQQDFDSLLLLLSKPDPDENAYLIYRLSNRSALRFGLPDISERTILQLQNAGGLRLIRNDGVSGAINEHYMNINRVKSYYETERFVRLKLVDTKSDILDAGLSMNPNSPPEVFRLVTKEKLKINRFMNDILAAKQVNNILVQQLEAVMENSSLLKELIEKEYHFE